MNRAEALSADTVVRDSQDAALPRAHRLTFGALFGAQLDRLYSAALRLTRHSSAADHLVRETMVTAWRSSEVLRRSKDPRKWLFGVLVSIYMRECRAAQGMDLDGFDGRILRDWIQESSHWHRGRLCAEAALQRITDEDVCAALDTLPPALLIPVVLKDVAGFAYAEIARLLHISDEAAKMRLFAGRMSLENGVLTLVSRRMRSEAQRVEARPDSRLIMLPIRVEGGTLVYVYGEGEAASGQPGDATPKHAA